MLKILLPVDFSESTDAAIQYALTLAAAEPGAHLLLLHCFQDYLTEGNSLEPETSLSSTEVITEQVLHRNEIEAQQQLDELYTSLLNKTRAAGQKLVLERAFMYGLPEEVIPAQIEGYNPTLVMMGTKGEPNLARSFFGTIVTHVLKEIRVPVLTVPQMYQGAAFRNVLYATDFDKTDTEAIETLEELLQPFNVSILCVHISDGTIPADSEKLAALRKKLQSSGNTTNIQFRLLEGDDVAESLLELVNQENINLVALTTRERNLLDSILHPSLASKLVLEANVPLLIFHSK